jgi:hypothetical protein
MTAEEAGYNVTNTSFDYMTAGKRCHNIEEDAANDCFETLARQHGVVEGPYGSWDMFWMGYFNT